MTTLQIEIPEDVFPATGIASDELAKEMKLAAAISWYEQGKISQEIAAKISGLDRTDFLLALARLGKDSFQVDFDDLDRELAREQDGRCQFARNSDSAPAGRHICRRIDCDDDRVPSGRHV